jgi:rRNA maturation endonuclease Nob1
MMNNAMNQTNNQTETLVVCPSCNAHVKPGKFCLECGKPLAKAKVRCIKCNAEIDEGSKFCNVCGASQEVVTITCPKCNTSLPSGSKFCPNCGEKL